MVKKRVGLDPGHGGADPGAKGNGIVEADWNMAFCRRLKYTLDDLVDPVLLRDRHDEDVSLMERGSRSLGCDLTYCVHVNAAWNPKWHGFLVFHWPTNALMRKLGNLLMRSAPPPLYKPGWNSIAATSEPTSDDDWLQRPRNVLGVHDGDSILLEVGYCSNEDDALALGDPYVVEALAAQVRLATAHWLYSL